jgi:Reverse transcriptase (RNA-dependent DNA polymerase)
MAMDDMALTSKRTVDIKRFKSKIKEFWDIMDHGPIKWFLGFETKRDRKLYTILIHQHAYIEAMVQKF